MEARPEYISESHYCIYDDGKKAGKKEVVGRIEDCFQTKDKWECLCISRVGWLEMLEELGLDE